MRSYRPGCADEAGDGTGGETMRVSVCMAIYNGIRFIEQQLECIRKQTRKPDEVILCDDGSTDGTGEFLRKYLEQNQDTTGWKLFLNEENRGYPGNFYHAMSLCTGDIVFLADQDDLWDLRKIGRMCEKMVRYREIRVLCCTFRLIDGADETIHTVMAPAARRGSGEVRQVSVEQVFYKCEWPGMVLAYRNDWYRSEVKQSVHKIPHDFLLCARAAEDHGFFQLEECLAFHRRHESNAGGEEHRIGRLLKKERKLKEIAEYKRILNCFSDEEVMRTEEGKAALWRKQRSMQGRYEALRSGKSGAVLGNAWRHRREVRLATLICDLAIVKQRKN